MMYTLLTSLHIYTKNFTVGLYYMVDIHNFLVNEGKFPSFDTEHMFGLSQSET